MDLHDQIRRITRYFAAVFSLCAVMSMTCACGADLSDTKVVLTTGLNRDEVFRIESASCTRPEIMVYLTNMQDQYENVYGEQIFDIEAGGVTLEDRVKDNALAKMAQVKTMNLMAADMGLELSAQELKSVEHAADLYYDSLNEAEIRGMGIDRDTIASLYREYLLARKVYGEIIRDVNPEVSDDEARNITLEYILINTYTTDGTGRRTPMSPDESQAAYRRAVDAHTRAEAGDDFASLVAEYSDSQDMVISIGKDDIANSYVSHALFDLAGGEISEILTVDDGYLIARCVSTYNLEETDLNKIVIVEKERESVFGAKYDEYVSTLTRKLNDQLWEDIGFLHDENITTSDFFKIADDNLEMDQ